MAKLVVTRPKHQAPSLIDALNNAGHTAVSVPLLNIEPLSITPTFSIQNDISIFTSPNAVEFSQKTLTKEQWDTLIESTVLAIGEATFRALAKLGVDHCQYPERANSEGLLAHDALQFVTNKRIILISGQGGRVLISQQLKQRGASIEKLEVYRRSSVGEKSIKLALANHGREYIWIISSQEALQHLHHCLDKPVKLLVTSERLKQVAQQLGFDNVLVSNSALTQDIVTAATNL